MDILAGFIFNDPIYTTLGGIVILVVLVVAWFKSSKSK